MQKGGNCCGEADVEVVVVVVVVVSSMLRSSSIFDNPGPSSLDFGPLVLMLAFMEVVAAASRFTGTDSCWAAMVVVLSSK